MTTTEIPETLPEGDEASTAPDETTQLALAQIGEKSFDVAAKLNELGLLNPGGLQKIALSVSHAYATAFLSNEPMRRASPGSVESAVRLLLSTRPGDVVKFAKVFAAEPWAREVLLAVVLNGKDNNTFFDYVEDFGALPWAEEVLLAAVAHDGAWSAFNRADKLIAFPFAEKILRAAGSLNTWAALKFVERYSRAPFARDLLIDLVSKSYVQDKSPPMAHGTLQLTIRNGTPFGIDDLQGLVKLPFAGEILTAFAAANPEIVKARPRAFAGFPGIVDVLYELGVDSVAAGVSSFRRSSGGGFPEITSRGCRF